MHFIPVRGTKRFDYMRVLAYYIKCTRYACSSTGTAKVEGDNTTTSSSELRGMPVVDETSWCSTSQLVVWRTELDGCCSHTIFNGSQIVDYRSSMISSSCCTFSSVQMLFHLLSIPTILRITILMSDHFVPWKYKAVLSSKSSKEQPMYTCVQHRSTI